MKINATLFYLIVVLFFSAPSYAQNVGIGTTGPQGKLDVRIPSGAGTWDRFVVNTTSEWGDGTTEYVTIGAGGASGIMLSNPHVTWRGNRSSIRYGRVGGVSSGEYWDAGVRTDASFTINMNGSTEYFTVESNGNVGIGATTPTQKLDVEGTIAHSGFMQSRGGTYTSTWMQYDEAQYGNSLILGAGGLTAIGSGESASQVRSNVAAGTETLYVTSDNGMNFMTSLQAGWATGVTAMNIATDGNVGIGATPSAKLHVDGTVRLQNIGSSSANSTILTVDANGYVTTRAAGSWAGGGGDNLGNHTATTNLAMQGLEIDNVRYVDVTAGNGHGIRFWQSDSYAINMGNAAEHKLGAVSDYSIKMNMNNQTNRGWTWGVDGLTPVASLNTQGILRIDNRLEIDGNTVIDDGGGWHRSYGSTGWYNGTYGGGIYMSDATWVRTYGNKSFYHNTGTMRTDGTFQVGSGGSRFVVNTAGNVGINSTSPTQMLHVYRNTNPGGGHTVIYGQSAGASSVATGGSITNTSNTYAGVEGNSVTYNGIGVRGLASHTSGGYSIYGTGPSTGWAGYFAGYVGAVYYYNVSDERFKKDIDGLSEYQVLDKLMQLEPKAYEFDTETYPGLGATPGKRQFGFIAQELQGVFPEVVTEEKSVPNIFQKSTAFGETTSEQGYYMVDYVSMVPLLVQGIQEQQEIIEKLEERIKELEDQK